MLFSSGTLGRFLTILTGTLANPSMYCSGHNNLPPLRLPREGKLIIPETFKLFPDISLLHHSQTLMITGESYRLREKRKSGLIRSTLASTDPEMSHPETEVKIEKGS